MRSGHGQLWHGWPLASGPLLHRSPCAHRPPAPVAALNLLPRCPKWIWQHRLRPGVHRSQRIMYTEHSPHAGTPSLTSTRQSAVTRGQRHRVQGRMSVRVFCTSGQANVILTNQNGCKGERSQERPTPAQWAQRGLREGRSAPAGPRGRIHCGNRPDLPVAAAASPAVGLGTLAVSAAVGVTLKPLLAQFGAGRCLREYGGKRALTAMSWSPVQGHFSLFLTDP